MARRLKQRRKRNADRRHREVDRDDSKRRVADLVQLRRRVKDGNQRARADFKHDKTRNFNNKRNHATDLHRTRHTLLVARTVVVAHNRHEPLRQAEHRHKHKGLQFKVNTEHIHGHCGKSCQNAVHCHGHQRADGVHHDARQTYNVNVLHRLAVETEALKFQRNRVVAEKQNAKAHNHRKDLAANRRIRRTGHAHVEVENEDRVKDDVCHRAHKLNDHRHHHVARRL